MALSGYADNFNSRTRTPLDTIMQRTYDVPLLGEVGLGAALLAVADRAVRGGPQRVARKLHFLKETPHNRQN
jgi:hypothetical protein